MQGKKCKKFNFFQNQNDTCAQLFTLVMKFHDRQSSERCIRKLISHLCLDKTRTRWNDFLFLITDDRDFRPQTCTNGLVFRECKHIKNIFEDVYFTKNLFHITFKSIIIIPSPIFKTNTHISFISPERFLKFNNITCTVLYTLRNSSQPIFFSSSVRDSSSSENKSSSPNSVSASLSSENHRLIKTTDGTNQIDQNHILIKITE